MQCSHVALSLSVLCTGPSCNKSRHERQAGHKRAATQAVKSLGLQADSRARALVVVAADSIVGNSLRDLLQLNEDDPALKALVEEFLRGEVPGKAIVCTDNMQFGKIHTADVSPIVVATYSTSSVPSQTAVAF